MLHSSANGVSTLLLSFHESQAFMANIPICVSVVERQRGERKKLTLIAYPKFSFVQRACSESQVPNSSSHGTQILSASAGVP